MIVACTRRSDSSIAVRPVSSRGDLSHADRVALTYRAAADLVLALDGMAAVYVTADREIVIESEVPMIDEGLELVVRAALALRPEVIR